MTNYCIAALPEQNDPVWKVSSEKKPHMTILYFEDPQDKIDQPALMLYIQHVTKTVLRPSGISVERRGVLGDQGADVIFFEDAYGFLDHWKAFRNALLQDQQIFVAVENTFQYPKWTPHLTLGYPETPAHDVEEAKYLSHVRFDRIAVWTDDYAGPEFLLTRSSYSDHETTNEVAMSEEVTTFLEHYGVKGMKWGVIRTADQLARAATGRPPDDNPREVVVNAPVGRKVRTSGGENQSASQDAVVAATRRQIAKKSTTDALSTQELQELVTRMNLEQQYSKLSVNNKGPAQKFITDLLGNTAKQEANKYAQQQAGKLVASFIAKKAVGL